MIAKGAKDVDIIPLVNVSTATYYGWKKRKEFISLLDTFREVEIEHAAELASIANQDDVARSYSDETWLREQLKPILENYIDLVGNVVEHFKDDIESFSPRQLPNLLQSLTCLVENFRSSNDRLAGLEEILSELSRIEKERSKKIISIASANDSEAA